MLLVASGELFPSISMRRAAEVLERVGCGYTAEPGADAVRRADRQALHETAAKRVANAGRILNAVRANRGHVFNALFRVNAASVLALRHDQNRGVLEDVELAHPGLLPQQLHLVVLEDPLERAGHARGQL